MCCSNNKSLDLNKEALMAEMAENQACLLPPYSVFLF